MARSTATRDGADHTQLGMRRGNAQQMVDRLRYRIDSHCSAGEGEGEAVRAIHAQARAGFEAQDGGFAGEYDGGRAGRDHFVAGVEIQPGIISDCDAREIADGGVRRRLRRRLRRWLRRWPLGEQTHRNQDQGGRRRHHPAQLERSRDAELSG